MPPPLEDARLVEELRRTLGTGRLLFEADSALRGAFEDRALGSYVRLNEERREILGRVT